MQQSLEENLFKAARLLRLGWMFSTTTLNIHPELLRSRYIHVLDKNKNAYGIKIKSVFIISSGRLDADACHTFQLLDL